MFRKNPAAMPELVSFAFFAESINLHPSKVCLNMNRLLKASNYYQGEAEVIESEEDQTGFTIGDNFGCIFKRMQQAFPQDRLDLDDPSIHRVVESKEHWVLVALTDDHPMKRFNDLTKLSMMMQAMSMTHQVKAFVTSPLGIIFRGSEWSEMIKIMLGNGVFPLQCWVGYDQRVEDGQAEVCTLFMDEVFGFPNIELVRSRRIPEETLDLLECAVIETIMHGPIHKRTKQWVTNTGIVFKVKLARSIYCSDRKSTRLIEA